MKALFICANHVQFKQLLASKIGPYDLSEATDLSLKVNELAKI